MNEDERKLIWNDIGRLSGELDFANSFFDPDNKNPVSQEDINRMKTALKDVMNRIPNVLGNLNKLSP